MVNPRKSEDGREGAAAVGSTVTSLSWPVDSALSSNHNYGHGPEELSREIRFHVVKRFSEEEQQQADLVLTR